MSVLRAAVDRLETRRLGRAVCLPVQPGRLLRSSSHSRGRERGERPGDEGYPAFAKRKRLPRGLRFRLDGPAGTTCELFDDGRAMFRAVV